MSVESENTAPTTEDLIDEVKTLNSNLYKMRFLIYVAISAVACLLVYAVVITFGWVAINDNATDIRHTTDKAKTAADDAKESARVAKALAAKVDCQANLRAKVSAIGQKDIDQITQVLVLAAQGKLVDKELAARVGSEFLETIRKDKAARKALGSTNPKACG